MNQLELFQGKKCVLCGRFFETDSRVGRRQKCCRAPECQKKRKKLQLRAWRLKNPGYFQGRYDYVKIWRAAHPGYQNQRRCYKRREIQTQIPSESPIKSMRLHLRCKWPLDEIQTQILRVTQSGRAFWVDGVRNAVSVRYKPR